MDAPIRFTKASGAGNDFVVIDATRGASLPGYAALARAACDRHAGVGADGLIVLEAEPSADFRMRYYNADGSHGGMCGNGGRCAARFAHDNGIAGPSQRFVALDYVYEAEVAVHGVRLRMKPAARFRRGVRVQAAGETFEVCFIDTGSPHVVVFVEDLDRVNVTGWGRPLRNAPAFAPEGANVNFVSVHGPDAIAMRTYERGVEAETLACGTGAIASAVVSSILHGIRPPVRVHARSGETLTVEFRRTGDAAEDVALSGSAVLLFTGEFRYDEAAGRIHA